MNGFNVQHGEKRHVATGTVWLYTAESSRSETWAAAMQNTVERGNLAGHVQLGVTCWNDQTCCRLGGRCAFPLQREVMCECVAPTCVPADHGSAWAVCLSDLQSRGLRTGGQPQRYQEHTRVGPHRCGHGGGRLFVLGTRGPGILRLVLRLTTGHRSSAVADVVAVSRSWLSIHLLLLLGWWLLLLRRCLVAVRCAGLHLSGSCIHSQETLLNCHKDACLAAAMRPAVQLHTNMAHGLCKCGLVTAGKRTLHVWD